MKRIRPHACHPAKPPTASWWARRGTALLIAAIATLGAWQPAHAANDWAYVHVDTFDNANVTLDYGLNDRLSERRLYLGNAPTWVRRAGAWYDKPIIREWWSQVNHPYGGPNQLSFHSELSAVMLNSSIASGVDGGYRIAFKTDPVIGNTTDGEWTSVMLDASSAKRGYVTETNFGFLIRSNGQMSVFQNGTIKTLSVGAVPAAASYDVDLKIKSGLLQGTVNGVAVSAALDTIPANAYLYLGAYIDANTGKVSTFDDLSVRVAASTQKRVTYSGYYWADGYYGAHIPEVSAHSNFNFVENIDGVDAAKCANKSCVVQIRWEFFNGSNLRADWQSAWQATFSKIQQKQSYIAAVYHVDEPFLASGANVSVQDLQTVINRVAADLATIPSANIKQMVNFSEPELNQPALYAKVAALQGIDLVAFDAYVAPGQFNSTILPLISKLKSAQPGKPIVLVPQTALLGVTSDAQIAQINWMYYNQALLDNSVVGLMYFGYWTTDSPVSTPANRPLAFKTQQLIGKAILD